MLFVPNCPTRAGWGGIPNYPTINTLVFETIKYIGGGRVGNRCKKGLTLQVYPEVVMDHGILSVLVQNCLPPQFLFVEEVIFSLPKIFFDVSVRAFHGGKDRNAPVSGSRNMVTAIKKAVWKVGRDEGEDYILMSIFFAI